MDIKMDGTVENGWMVGWIDKTNIWMVEEGRIQKNMKKQMDGWLNGFMKKQMDGWMDRINNYEKDRLGWLDR